MYPGILVLGGAPPSLASSLMDPMGRARRALPSPPEPIGNRSESAAALSTPPGGPQSCPRQSPPPGQQHWAQPFIELRLYTVRAYKAVFENMNSKARDLALSSIPDPYHLCASSSPSLCFLIHKMMLGVESNNKGHCED